jgi:hypothetical protein
MIYYPKLTMLAKKQTLAAGFLFVRQTQRSERRLCHPSRGEDNLNGKGVTGDRMIPKQVAGPNRNGRLDDPEMPSKHVQNCISRSPEYAWA